MTAFDDYKVADISLADWGKKEISIAELLKCQALMALREKYRAETTPSRSTNFRLYSHDYSDRCSY